ncbi:MAG: single-stranded DNA-binding protein [Spirochaetales bacterium]|nr:single-stranded DNA-binding protein [Spirochaetales bacterium]
MEYINNLIIDGNLTKDPEFKETANGRKLCVFSIANNRYYRTKEEAKQETSFFEVETWAQEAEDCSRKLEKGKGVRVIGRLKQDRWEDTDGKQKSRIKIVAEHVYVKTIQEQKEREDSSPDNILVAV